MISTMMDVPLSLNHLLERAGKLFAGNQVVSRLPDKSLRRHSYGEYYRRTRALASALQRLGLRKGERVATLCRAVCTQVAIEMDGGDDVPSNERLLPAGAR